MESIANQHNIPDDKEREIEALFNEDATLCYSEYLKAVNGMTPYDMRESLFVAAATIKFLTENVGSLKINSSAQILEETAINS